MTLEAARTSAEPKGYELDAVPEQLFGPPATRLGDLWRLGAHRLYGGDAREAAAVARATNGALADIIFTDPPNEVRIEGNATGLGAQKHREFVMALEGMSEEELMALQRHLVGAPPLE